jgi:hypothetical protein
MDIVEKLMLPPHIIAGFLSIIVFWIPAFNRKGGVNHVRIGRWYVWCMWVVVVTAAFMSVENIYYGFYGPGAFLGFLALLTAQPLWRGIAILRHKQGITADFRRTALLLEGGVVFFGAAMAIAGILLQGESMAILMIVFGLLGLSNLRNFWRTLTMPSDGANWIVEHVKGMILSGIACYTAFFAFGGRRFLGEIFTDHLMIIPWVAPTVIGLTTMKILEKKYARKRQSVAA